MKTKVENLMYDWHNYEGWNTYTIRDAKTNVCLAVVGEVDRYFQNEYGEIAKRLSTSYNAVPELLEALENAIRLLIVADNNGAFENCALPTVGRRGIEQAQRAIEKATG